MTQEVKVGNERYLRVKLLENAEQLDEVVVLGYGSQTRASLTGAVSQIDSKVIGIQNVSTVKSL